MSLRFWALLALIMLVSLPGVNALTMNTVCNSSTGLYTELIYNYSSVVWNNTFSCPNGCAKNGLECDLPATPDIFLPIGIALAIISFVFVYLAYKIDEEHWPLQFLFIVFAILYIGYDGFVLSQFSQLTLNGLSDVMLLGMNLMIWTLFFVFLYFLYLFIKMVFDSLQKKKISGRPFKW